MKLEAEGNRRLSTTGGGEQDISDGEYIPSVGYDDDTLRTRLRIVGEPAGRYSLASDATLKGIFHWLAMLVPLAILGFRGGMFESSTVSGQRGALMEKWSVEKEGMRGTPSSPVRSDAASGVVA